MYVCNTVVVPMDLVLVITTLMVMVGVVTQLVQELLLIVVEVTLARLILLGNYAFIESSAPRRRGDIAILQIYGSGKDRCLFFAYHMWGTGVGSLSVYQQQLDWHIPPTVLWRRSGDQGNRWKEAQVSVKGYHKYKVTNRNRLTFSNALGSKYFSFMGLKG